VDEWLMWQMGGLGPMAGQAFHFLKYAPSMEPPNDLPYAKDRYRNEISRLFGVLDDRLRHNRYVAGDFYSIADMAIWPWVSLWRGMEQTLEDRPGLSRWLDELKERDEADSKRRVSNRRKTRRSTRWFSDRQAEHFTEIGELTMIFYDCTTAPSPRRARMFIAEKGLDIETRQVDLGKGEQLSQEFLAVNPLATVPVLVTDSGVTLTENIAIATYLEAVHPEPALMGSTAEERAQVMMWNTIVDQQCALPVADVLRNSHPKMAGRALPGPDDFEQIPELAARGKARVKIFHDRLEQQLQDRQYLVHSASLEWQARIADRPSAAV
jgi:glutathione S-transferase